MNSNTIYPITSVGAPLAELLPKFERPGTVFAVFRRSCYLTSGSGQVFSLADQQLGEGPLTMGVEFPVSTTLGGLRVYEGCHLERDGVDLRLGSLLVLTTTAAAIWKPESVGQTAQPGEILRRWEGLINLVRPLIPPDGLADIVPHTAALANMELPSFASMNEAIRLAVPHLCRLAEGLTRSNPEAIDRAVAGLVGLGPGLTPSGDDLLGGMLVALRTMPGTASHPSVGVLANYVTGHAAVRTNLISSAMLNQSAQGYGSAAQHRLLQCLLGGHDSPDTFNAALDLARTGHTSGWDALAGILLGINFGLRISRPQASPDSVRQGSIAFSRTTTGTPA